MNAISQRDAPAARAAALHHIEHAAIRSQSAAEAFWTTDLTTVARSLSLHHTPDDAADEDRRLLCPRPSNRNRVVHASPGGHGRSWRREGGRRREGHTVG